MRSYLLAALAAVSLGVSAAPTPAPKPMILPLLRGLNYTRQDYTCIIDRDSTHENPAGRTSTQVAESVSNSWTKLAERYRYVVLDPGRGEKYFPAQNATISNSRLDKRKKIKPVPDVGPAYEPPAAIPKAADCYHEACDQPELAWRVVGNWIEDQIPGAILARPDRAEFKKEWQLRSQEGQGQWVVVKLVDGREIDLKFGPGDQVRGLQSLY